MSGAPSAVILVVDDSPDVRDAVAALVARDGHEVITAAGGQEAIERFGEREPDLVVLDLVMPRMDGMGVLEYIRSVSRCPVIVLTASESERARVNALMRGADDFLAKPAASGELLARIKAVLRRSRSSAQPDGATVLDDGRVRIDLVTAQVHVDGVEVQFSRLEYRLLVALARRPGTIATKEDLLREVWGDSASGMAHSVKLYVGYVRRKLTEAAGADPIETVRGIGYRWVSMRSDQAPERASEELEREGGGRR